MTIAAGMINSRDAANNAAPMLRSSASRTSLWGGRPRPRRTPWSGSAITPEAEAGEGVDRGPGGPPWGPPHVAVAVNP